MVTAPKHFQSESLTDRLSIALLCDDAVVARQFSEVCKNKNIDIDTFSRKKIVNTLTDQSKTWYKIFWWIDGDESETDIGVILSLLRSRQELSYVFVPQPVSADKSAPQLLTKAGGVVTAIEQRAPYVSVFCYQDLIDGPQSLLGWELTQAIEGAVSLRESYAPISFMDYLTRALEESLIPRGGQRKVFVGESELSATRVSQLLSINAPQHTKNTPILPVVTYKKVSTASSSSEKQLQQKIVGMKLVAAALARHHQVEAKVLPKPSRRQRTADSLRIHSQSKVVQQEVRAPEVGEIRNRLPAQEVVEKRDGSIFGLKQREIIIPTVQPPVIRRSKLILDALSSQHPKHQVSVKKATPTHSIQPISRPISQSSGVQASPKKHIDLDHQVLQLFSPLTTQRPSQQPGSNDRARGIRIKRVGRKKLLTGAGLVILVMLGIAAYTLPQHVVSGVLEHDQSASRKVPSSSLSLAITKTLLQAARAQASVYSRVIPIGSFTTDQQRSQIALDSLQMQRSLGVLRDEATLLLRQVFDLAEGDVVQTAGRTQDQVETVISQLADVEVGMQQMGELDGGDQIAGLKVIKKQLTISQQAIRMFTGLLSQKPDATIAFLLQDSNEIRPSGGFIQTVALVTLKSGKIGSVKLLSPTELDNGVEAVIAAPNDLTHQLGEERLFPHDANWYVDFSESSQKIRWFIEKSHGTSVDGVIAINASLLQELLKFRGDVEVGESIVGAETLQDQIYARSSESIQPDVVGKDFFSQVFSTVIDPKKIDESKYLNIIAAVSRLLEQGEIQMNATLPSIQAQLRTLGWDGRVVQPLCPAQFSSNRCVVSSVYQLDSNVGLNKVGKFIKKKHQHNVEFKLDQTIHKHYLTYENYIRVSTWPGGDFSNYVRFALPRTAQLLSVRIGSNQIKLDQVDSHLSDDSIVIGFPISVPQQSSTDVEVVYTDQPVTAGESFAFFWQRQAGTGVTPLSVELQLADGMTPTLIAPEAKMVDGVIRFEFPGNQHAFAAMSVR